MSEPFAFLPVPVSLLLPLASLALLALAAVAAAFAWAGGAKRHSKKLTAWDVAAALTFLGCAAAILGEIEHVAEYFLLDRKTGSAR